MTTLFDAARPFDKGYDHYRLDVRSSKKEEDAILVELSFRQSQNSKENILAATKELHKGMHHQVRPFGSCRMVEVDSDYTVVIELKGSKISSVTTTSLMKRLISLAEDIVVTYHLGS